MNPIDRCGLPVTLAPEALDPWNRTVKAFLGHATATPTHLAHTLETDPRFALGWAVRGLMLVLLCRSELRPAAHASLARAREAVAAVGATARERVYVAALADWLSGRPSAAMAGLEALLARHPGDALALKLDQAIRFLHGDRHGMRRVAEAAGPAYDLAHATHPYAGYALGCLAFAREECGAFAAAEAAGRAGLERAADDVWGLHAVAHVYDMTARAETGIAWLEGRQGVWAHCNNFAYHVWWHLGLFHLDQGAYDRVLDLYDARIRPEHTDDYRDICNGASMLTRLEIEGVDVGTRWEELAALAAGRVEDGALVFADLHYLMALNGGDRGAEAEAMIARLARDGERREHEMHEVAAVAGHPTALGLAAFRAGRYALAFERLRDARARQGRIGGSHAQRDVFTRLMIEAAMRAGRLVEAEAELRARAARRGGVDGFTHRRLEALSRAARPGAASGAVQAAHP